MRSNIAVAALVSIAVFGCVVTTAKPHTASGQSCQDREGQARAQLNSAVERNLACASDQDCVNVEVQTACFDACTRAVSAKGAADVRAAMDSANGGVCRGYDSSGCQRIIPPCAPPRPPACVNGRCG
jgi:hypothetical protein